MVLTQKLRIAAFEQMFDLKWSRAHAGARPSLRWLGILRHPFGIVREYAGSSLIFQNYTRFSSIFRPKKSRALQFPSGFRENCQPHRVAQTNTQSQVKTPLRDMRTHL
jgi:hypothetical protein